MINYHYC